MNPTERPKRNGRALAQPFPTRKASDSVSNYEHSLSTAGWWFYRPTRTTIVQSNRPTQLPLGALPGSSFCCLVDLLCIAPRTLSAHSGSPVCFPGRAKQGSSHATSGVCHGLANYRLSARCTIAKAQKVRPQYCAVLSLLRASPGQPSLVTRRTHAFDPWTDLQRPGKQVRSTPLRRLRKQMTLHPSGAPVFLRRESHRPTAAVNATGLIWSDYSSSNKSLPPYRQSGADRKCLSSRVQRR